MTKAIPVPTVQQSTGWTCGPASLAAVAQKFGVRVNEADVARMIGADPEDGAPPEAMLAGAKQLGLQAQGVERMELPQLEAAVGKGKPVIVCLQAHGSAAAIAANQAGHWVVVSGATPAGIVLMDPAAGAGTMVVPRPLFLQRWIDQVADGSRVYTRFGIVVSGIQQHAERFSEDARIYADLVRFCGGKGGKKGKCGTGKKATPTPKKAAVKVGDGPKAMPWQDPPPPQGKTGEGMAARPVGDQSQTKIGDHAEQLAQQLGMRSLLPEGQRSFKPGEVATKGSTIDLEYDHSNRAYELKMCQTSATEYRLKAKAVEKENKLKFADQNGKVAYTMVGVRDPVAGETHFYAAKEPGMTGAAVSAKNFDYVGTVKH